MSYGDDWQLRAWERLEDSIRTGASGMSHAFGADLWTYLDQHPDSAEHYNKALTGLSALNDQIACVYGFPEDALVVDIGGGQGDLLRRILVRNSTVRGVLFDRKPVIDSIGSLNDPACRDRLSLIAGDFFESIPPDGDIYVMKQVLHDWDDPRRIQASARYSHVDTDQHNRGPVASRCRVTGVARSVSEASRFALYRTEQTETVRLRRQKYFDTGQRPRNCKPNCPFPTEATEGDRNGVFFIVLLHFA